uniref:Carboxylic ester hydrolase n=1 Tax=Strongyloides papillosus TaxID=174720 RepID=A0A0N5B6E3_STREA
MVHLLVKSSPLLIFVFLYLFYLLLSKYKAYEYPIVITSLGKLQGKNLKLQDGHVANLFLGIPYAEPPIGTNRFKKPVKKLPWKGLLTVDEYQKTCFSHVINIQNIANYSEDCLFLNIITPDLRETKKLPVVIWIHGGGYSTGGGSSFNINDISNIFTKNKIIFVTIQYRVGVLGWLYIKDNNKSMHNIGYWDQAMALNFIYDEINRFGGDKDKITILGGSAGAASAGALTISPITNHMIDKVIELSGSFLSKWSDFDIKNLEENSQLFISKMKCKNNNFDNTINCLQNKGMEDILEINKDIYDNYNTLQFGAFGPTISGEFFPDSIISGIKRSKNIVSFSGLTTEEAGYFTILGKSKKINKMILDKNSIKDLNSSFLTNFVDEKILKYTFNINNKGIRNELVEKILDFYLYKKYNNESEIDTKIIAKIYTKILSDIQFNLPCLNLAILRNTLRHTNYFYQTSYYNPNWYDEGIKDFLNTSTHTSEYWYFLGQSSTGNFITSNNDEAFRKTFNDLLINFIKSERSSDNDVLNKYLMKKKGFVKLNDRMYLPDYFIKLDKNISFSDRLPFLERYAFWDELDTYYNLNLFIKV